MKKLTTLLFCVCIMSMLCQAQDSVTYCNPRVAGQAPPKGLELGYERTIDYGFSANDPNNGNLVYQTEIRRVKRLSGKIRVPLLLTKGLKIYGGVSLHNEGYAFDKEEIPADGILKGIDEQPLRSSRFNLHILKPQKGNHWFYLTGNVSLNQNLATTQRPSEFFKFGITGLYGVKQSEQLAYGFGVSVGYLFGQASVYPVFMYNQTFNENWGIELTLPARAKLRYNQSERSIFYWVNELEGVNYDLDLVINDDSDIYYFERSEFESKLVFEREIYDFLWVGMSAGVRVGYALNLNNDFGINQGDVILEAREDPALRVGASIFLVPPKKWRK